MKHIILGLCFILLCACSERQGLAPVVESHWHNYPLNAQRHIVARGETLYAISFRYDQDYRHLAILNHLGYPYTLRIGQVLWLQQPKQPRFSRSIIRKPEPYRQAQQISNSWSWPAQGVIVSSFSPSLGRKGINIRGARGQSIFAAKEGIVAYAGNGLNGYGNLIIIKHNEQFLTAYGNNARNLVREGQHVRKSQAIALMGSLGRNQWGVHFEIRHMGKPVNPLNYLKNS